MPALSIISGIAAAAAGLAGEKISKNGTVPGLDITQIIEVLGVSSANANSGARFAGIAGFAAKAAKRGLLGAGAAGVAELAENFIKTKKNTGKSDKRATKPENSIAGLASIIAETTGKAADLIKIAELASVLAKDKKNDTELKGAASLLGKTLKEKFGIAFNLSDSSVLKELEKIFPSAKESGDLKGDLLKAILKNII
jgi:hypothetical protein